MTTESGIRQRAAAAQRLLDEPLLRDAFTTIEAAAFRDLLECTGAEPEDDRKRRALIDRVNVVRDVRAELEFIVSQGGRPAAQERHYA